MNRELKIGIIGDFDSNRKPHIPTNEAIKHAQGAEHEETTPNAPTLFINCHRRYFLLQHL